MKTVFFDHISFIHRPIIFLFLKLNYRIKIFNFSHNLKKNKWLVRHINNKKIETITLENNFLHGKVIDEAYNLNDEKVSILTQSLRHIIDEKNIKNILRKEMARLFFEYYSIIVSVKNTFYLFQSYFIAKKKIIEKVRNERLQISFKILKISFFTSFIERMFDFAKWKFVAFFYFLIKISILIILNLFGKKLKKKKFKFVIPIDQELHIKFKGKRSFNFFIDNKLFTKKNVLFLINFNVDKKWLKQQKSKGFNFYDTTKKRNFINLFLFKQNNKYLINSFIALIKNFFVIKSTRFEKTFYQILKTYLNFSNIFNFFKFESYIYTNEESISQNVKNSMLKNKNVKTWNYSSFIGGNFLTANSKKQFKEKRDVMWSFQNPENFLSANNDVIDYLKLHYQDTQNYYVSGTTYSQLVIEYRKEFNKIELLKKITSDNVDFSRYKKIISFFDTTFLSNNNFANSYNDGIKFCENILELSKRYKQIYFIYKNSKNEKFYVDEETEASIPRDGVKLIKKWNKLKKSENIFFANDNSDPSLIISASDAVFTHCLSSPWLEALESSTLSYWYESRGNFKDSLYSEFIINGMNELKNIVQNILLNQNKIYRTQKKTIAKVLKIYDFKYNNLDKIRKIIAK